MQLNVYLCLLALTGLIRAIDAAQRVRVPTPTAEKYTIELGIYVDKWAIEKWNKVIAAQQTWNNHVNSAHHVQDIMIQHIRAIIKGVNNIYTSLMEYGINIDIRIAGLHFITEGEIVQETTQGSRMVDKVVALETLGGWMDHRPLDEHADHTMLFTGLNITGDSTEANTIGIGYVGNMCSDNYSLTVVELQPPGGLAVVIAAHELGHSLNASHDGESHINCPSDSYVMSAVAAKNSTNSYHFSSCSALAISRFLSFQSRSPQGSCLSTSRTTVPVDSTAPALGNILSLDHLCQMGLMPQSFLSRGHYGIGGASYSTVCASVWCSIADGTGWASIVTSGDGFVCGHNKVCHLGACVDSRREINVPDSCPFGDAPVHANVDNNASCTGLAVSGRNASLCYSLYYRRACCSSCAAAYLGKPGCEYGDKVDWCPSLPVWRCYQYSSTCCATCLNARNDSNVGCEYGDKVNWCTSLPVSGCYNNDHVCCGTCGAARNDSNIGCEYGDKVRGCDHTVLQHCTVYADKCCKTCHAS